MCDNEHVKFKENVRNKAKMHYSFSENVQESKILEHFKNSLFCKLSHRRDLNHRPADYESDPEASLCRENCLW